jgi:hypothetical protein
LTITEAKAANAAQSHIPEFSPRPNFFREILLSTLLLPSTQLSGVFQWIEKIDEKGFPAPLPSTCSSGIGKN